MRRSKEYSGNTSSCHAGLNGAVDGRLLLGSWFLGKVRPKHELQILFGQEVVDETWNVCVLMCAECVGKDNMAYGLQCLACSSALGTPSMLVRIFRRPFPAPIPFHPLICLSLDANTGQKLKLKRSPLPT